MSIAEPPSTIVVIAGSSMTVPRDAAVQPPLTAAGTGPGVAVGAGLLLGDAVGTSGAGPGPPLESATTPKARMIRPASTASTGSRVMVGLPRGHRHGTRTCGIDLDRLEDGVDGPVGRLVRTQVEPGSGDPVEVAFAGHAIRPSWATGAVVRLDGGAQHPGRVVES